MVASKLEIEQVLNTIRRFRSNWYLSKRSKNYLTLQRLGIGPQVAFDEIYTRLSWQDYISGPECDRHVPPVPGQVWVFGLTIEDCQCYLKFQLRPNKMVIWISLHQAEYPLKYPYLKEMKR